MMQSKRYGAVMGRVLLAFWGWLCVAPCPTWAVAGPFTLRHQLHVRQSVVVPVRSAAANRMGGVGVDVIEENVGKHYRKDHYEGWWWRPLSMAFLSLLMVAGAAQSPVQAENALVSSKIMAGAASTQDSGVRKNITRGINLERANFSNRDLSGVSFQQSIIRDAKFIGTKLVGTSFFDADLANSDFTGADMTQANLELARLTGANFTNTIAMNMYVNGTTRMEPETIEGADFSETIFRKDQLQYLCKIARGTNPVTKVDTRESLMCPE